jgi:AcrR family transcriptional regulator
MAKSENNRKQQIILAAVKRFTKHGVNKTTLSEIARDLRIGKATIYHYFQSKEELYYATIELRSNEYLEEIQNIFSNEEKPFEEKLIEYFQFKYSFEEKYQLLYELILLVLKDSSFEPELKALESLLKREKEIMKGVFNKINKIKYNDSPLPEFLATQSWGLMFGQKLNSLSSKEHVSNNRDLIQNILKNILE